MKNLAPTKRGRPKNVARRTEIALRAASLFARRGYAGTTMSEIARTANIGESLLYHYFPRKSDILDALVDYNTQLLADLAKRCTAAVRDAHSCEAFLLAFGAEYVAYIAKVHDLLVLWLMDIKLISKRAEAAKRLAAEIYATFGQRLGALPDYTCDTDPVAALRFFLAGIYLLNVYARRMDVPLPSGADYDELLAEAARFTARACRS